MALKKVKVENGLIEGTQGNIPTISIFKGIPYAAPPIGELRWREPQPLEDWDGVYDATKYKTIPPQIPAANPLDRREFYGFGCEEQQSEDCLFLNVWTPADSEGENLPVMFFIHGGGFYQGYSYDVTIDGEAFGKNGCILVSAEYRLSVLGFLAHEELTKESGKNASGNYGLLDLAAAIKWVRRNIKAFGGNPDNITVFGQSAGALSTINLVCSPLTEGDIAKAMIHSGGGYSGNAPGLLENDDLASAEKLGAEFFSELGVNSVKEAREVPFEKILELQAKYGLGFRPIVDGYFLKQSPNKVMMESKHHNIPYIIGCTAVENGWYRGQKQEAKVIDMPAEAFKANAEKYYGKHSETYLDFCGFYEDPEIAIVDIFNESIHAGVLGFCEHEATLKDRKPTYMYYFNRQIPGDDYGAFHAGDLWYMFHTINRSWRPNTGVDFNLANAMNKFYSNFAKTGNPNDENLPEWKPYTKLNREAIEFSEAIKMVTYPGSARIKMAVDMFMGRLDG